MENEQLHDANGDIETHRYEMQEAVDSANRVNGELRRELSALKDENEHLSMTNSTLENGAANTSSDVERCRKELAAVKKENQQAMEQLQSTWDELTEASSKRVALQTELDEMDERLAHCEADLADSRDAEDMLTQQLDTAAKDLDDERARGAELLDDIDLLHKQVEELQHGLQVTNTTSEA